MQRAGAAVARTALSLIPTPVPEAPVLVAAGPGNNGGDALVAAELLARHGARVHVLLLADESALSTEAGNALAQARQSSAVFTDTMPENGLSLAIDGLFGIGLTRSLEGRYRDVAIRLNGLRCPVLAIDVPSGLDADTGNIVGADGVAVRASDTITFIADKPGLHTLHGRDNAGRVRVDTLGIDAALFPEPVAQLNSPEKFIDALRPRRHASHKGSYGDLTVMGGAEGMSGAVILAARMGLMAGAGRVFAGFIGTAPAFDPIHPELMCRRADQLTLNRGVLVVGPGLGLSLEAQDTLGRALTGTLPLVIDADGLNLIAVETPLQRRLAQRRAPTLLTPHPLEAARLLSTDLHTVQSDRLRAAKTLAQQYRCTVILKGSGSLIAQPDAPPVINTTGNPSLATAGSGDVLAGLCGALLAQGVAVGKAALAAVWLHGHAADQRVAGGTGPVGATASELIPFIRTALNQAVNRSAG